MDISNDEDRKIFLSPKVAQRVFSEQLKTLIETFAGTSDTMINLHEVLVFHKKHYGYQILPQSLGYDDILTCIKELPYVEVICLIKLKNDSIDKSCLTILVILGDNIKRLLVH